MVKTPQAPAYKIWVKKYGKQKEGFYRDRFPYIYLNQLLNEVERRPQDFYLLEDNWFAFCRETKVEGISWLRQLIGSRPRLFALVHPHLKSESEQQLSERVGLQSNTGSGRVRSLQDLLKPESSATLEKEGLGTTTIEISSTEPTNEAEPTFN